MKMSTKGQYSLRAMVALAQVQQNQEEGMLSISQMAKQTGVTVRYLEKLLRSLKAAGLVETTRGAAGGYRLAKPAECITVGQVLQVGEGRLEPVECIQSDGRPCDRKKSCAIQYVWQRISESIHQVIDEMTLKEVASQTPDENQSVI